MKYAYLHATVLDGTEHMVPRPHMTVLTDGELITKITNENVDLQGYEMIDLKDAYLMPGLINMHVHLPTSGKPKTKQPDNRKLVKFVVSNPVTRKYLAMTVAKYARMELNSGCTTIRTVGGIQCSDSTLRNKILAGKIIGPRILTSDMAVSVPGGHMAGSLAYEATSAEEARQFVRKIAQAKPDLIKLMITGGVLDATVKGEPGVLKMKPELVKAACDEAHHLGLPVAAHVESPEGVRVALANGVDTIEHGALPDEEILSLFREHHACHVATLSPALPYALFDRSVSHASELEQYNGKIVFDGIISCARACLASGIPVGLGTDTGCPFITHYDMWRELRYFEKFCGVSPAFALHTATQINARILGMEDKIGTLTEGKCADMIVCRSNPLDDLCALRHLELVVARGTPIHDIQNKKSAMIENELDQFL